MTEMSRERRNVLRGAQAQRKIMQEKKTFRVLNQHVSDQDVLFDLKVTCHVNPTFLKIEVMKKSIIHITRFPLFQKEISSEH